MVCSLGIRTAAIANLYQVIQVKPKLILKKILSSFYLTTNSIYKSNSSYFNYYKLCFYYNHIFKPHFIFYNAQHQLLITSLISSELTNNLNYDGNGWSYLSIRFPKSIECFFTFQTFLSFESMFFKAYIIILLIFQAYSSMSHP